MVSGRRPFTGESVPEILRAIIGSEPDWSALPEALPEPILSLMRRCLAKDPNQRMHPIADARIELDELASSSVIRTAVPTQTSRTRTLRILGLAAGSAAALLLAALGVNLYRNSAPKTMELIERPLTNKPVDDPILHAALSTDGQFVVYNDNTAIHIHHIDTGEIRSISGASPGIPADFCFR
jgi:hypothetical protein